MVTGAVAIGSSLIASRSASKSSKRAGKQAEEARRRFGNTGRSSFDTATGRIKFDKQFQQRTALSRGRIDSTRGAVNSAFGDFGTGIAGIREQLGDIRKDFDSNSGAFIQSQLDPVQERIAAESGEQERELGRRGVFGSFGQQAKAATAFRGAQTEAGIRAQAENQRINTLGNFLQMDADLLKAGLTSETGRVDMLNSIEGILEGITQDEFNREVQLLKIASGQAEGSQALDSAAANARGVAEQARLSLAGDVIGGLSQLGGGGSPGLPPGGVTTASAAGGI